MNSHLQQIAALIIVAGACFFLIRGSIMNRRRPKASSCGHGCDCGSSPPETPGHTQLMKKLKRR